MQISPNPYKPGAGTPPLYLAGRRSDMDDAKVILASIAAGLPMRSVIYYGLRGVGKTVLLNKIEEEAKDLDIPAEFMEIEEKDGAFHRSVAFYVHKLIQRMSVKEKLSGYVRQALSILKAFSIKYSAQDISIEVQPANGISDTGDLQNDMTELFLALGKIAEKNERGAALFIDEIQNIDPSEFSALMAAMHRVNQKGYPLIIFAAGLPKVAKLAGDTKSYAERLFQFKEIGHLSDEEAAKALTEPARRFKVSYEDKAVQKVITETEGYPYFVQEYGKVAWDLNGGALTITAQTTDEAKPDFERNLDESFFKVRHDRATHKELCFLVAMAECQERPCKISEVAERLHMELKSISPLRAQLVSKGLIYPVDRGVIDFTVPHFDRFLRRHYPSGIEEEV